MKKYLYIFKTTVLDSIQYISSILFRFISYIISIYVLFSAWSYIYGDTSNLINGYNLSQMMWYILMAEIITYGGNSKAVMDEVNESIKGGNIAYYVNKPYHYLGYIFMKYMGECLIRIILYAIVSISLALIFVGSIPGFNFLNLPLIILVFLLALIINAIIKISISLIAFWVEDSEPFHWVYSKVMLILGVFFPIEMFPLLIRPFIKYSPIFVIIYGPSKLVANFSLELFNSVLISQLIYLLITVIIMILIYRKGVKRVNVNGG